MLISTDSKVGILTHSLNYFSPEECGLEQRVQNMNSILFNKHIICNYIKSFFLSV